MLSATLGRNTGNGTLQDLQQSLLDALARNVTGDGGIFALTGDLIHFIDVDDAPFCPLHIKIRSLQQANKDILHIVAHIAGLGQCGGVSNGKGHIQDLGQGLGKEGLAGARGTDQQDVALLQFHIGIIGDGDTLIVIIHSHGKGDLCLLLADNIAVHVLLDLHGGGQPLHQMVGYFILVQQFAAGLHAIAANIHTRACDEPGLMLPLAAETATDGFFFGFRHAVLPPFGKISDAPGHGR